MTLRAVEPIKPGAVERLLTMGKREPLALIAVGLAAMALYKAWGGEVDGLQEAARILLSQPMTVGTSGP